MPSGFYRIDFRLDDSDDLQACLNHLYGYADDLSTKVHHRNRLNLFVTLLDRLIADGTIESFDAALDIGCNAGVYSKLLSERGFRSVVGVDIDAGKIEQARSAFASDEAGSTIKFDQVNAEEIERLGVFDFVLCTEVIEHTERPEKVIENIGEVLATGGVAVVSLPNALSLPFLLTRLAHAVSRAPRDPELRRHLRYPFYHSLRLFEGRGLERVTTTGTNLVLVGPLIRRLYGRRPFPVVNEFNFRLAARWPFKYVSQFFFIVLKKDGVCEDGRAVARSGT